MGGIFGIATKENNAQIYTYYGLNSIQHRGEYGCGIASNIRGYIDYVKGFGLANDVFDETSMQLLRSKTAIGSVSNSQVDIEKSEIDPKVIGINDNSIAVAIEGSILNYDEIKSIIDEAGIEHENNTSTEVFSQLIGLNYKGDIYKAVKDTLKIAKGPYSALIMIDNNLIAYRDYYGITSLTLGSLKNDGGYILSSETCAIDALDGKFISEINPGEIIYLNNSEVKREQLFEEKANKSCVFETIYTSRPDSLIKGESVYKKRFKAGKTLGEKNTLDADVVIAAPDSGTVFAIGYAEGAKIPYGMGIVKNRYVGRTFGDKDAKSRETKVRIKLNVLREVVEDKVVILVDDSIVRGTTMKRTVKMVKDAGAKSVHVRIASPMVFFDCKLGVNKSVTGQMLAKSHSLEEMKDIINADSLEYIDEESMLDCFGNRNNYCTGCINNIYPMNLEEEYGL